MQVYKKSSIQHCFYIFFVYIVLNFIIQEFFRNSGLTISHEINVPHLTSFRGTDAQQFRLAKTLQKAYQKFVKLTNPQRTKLDGDIGQGEICNSLKSEKFSKPFLSHIGKNKIKFQKKYFFGYHEALRGVIFKIQPLRNPSIFNNMICVPISKVLLKGQVKSPTF